MSAKHLAVGNVAAAPGQKQFTLIEFTAGGEAISFPVFLINGQESGPTLVVTAGVHAAEYASIAAALELGQTLEPDELCGRVIVAPIVNVPGFAARSIYVCPLDGKNPNRCFPGDSAGSGTEQLAAWVFENIIRQADYYVDLHGGDLVEALSPFTIVYRSQNDQVNEASLAMARAFAIPAIVHSETAGGAYSSAATAGIPAILTEAGGNGLWSKSDVALHRDGLHRLMHHLGMLHGTAPEPRETTLYGQFPWLRSEHAGFWYPAIRVGEQVRAGQELGRVCDYMGTALQVATAPIDGVVLFLVTSLAISPNDPLVALGA